MAASKHVRMHVNTLPQCSPASVGLAQASPNNEARPHFLADITLERQEEVVLAWGWSQVYPRQSDTKLLLEHSEQTASSFHLR